MFWLLSRGAHHIHCDDCLLVNVVPMGMEQSYDCICYNVYLLLNLKSDIVWVKSDGLYVLLESYTAGYLTSGDYNIYVLSNDNCLSAS